jgi:hypothetical protein
MFETPAIENGRAASGSKLIAYELRQTPVRHHYT